LTTGEAVEREDKNPYDEEHERHESDIFDQTISLMDILDERFTSENVYVLPPYRRCACHKLNLICKCDIYKNMEPSLNNLLESTDNKLKSIYSGYRKYPYAERISRENAFFKTLPLIEFSVEFNKKIFLAALNLAAQSQIQI
jgi:hypothetical protein